MPPTPFAEQPDVSVVIVHHNAPLDLVESCLDALTSASPAVRVQTVLVDQSGAAALRALLDERFPHVAVVEDRSDRGYAVSNNLGLRQATGRYLLLLNDDVVLARQALATLVAFMDGRPQAGYAGPRLTLPDGRLDLACRRSFPTPLVSLYRLSGLSRLFPASRTFGRYNMTYLSPDRTTRVDAVVGACLLVRRAAAEQAGLLDERYFMYGEDLDWCARLHAAGWHGWYVASACALHHKGSSSRRRPWRTTYEFYRAMAIYFRCHEAADTPAAVTWLVLTGILLRGLGALAATWAASGGRSR